MKSFNDWLNESSSVSLNKEEKDLLIAIYEDIIPKLIGADLAFEKWRSKNMSGQRDDGGHVTWFKGMKEGIKKLKDDNLLGTPDSDLGSAENMLSYHWGPGGHPSKYTTFSKTINFTEKVEDFVGRKAMSWNAQEFKIGDIPIYVGFMSNRHQVYIFEKDIEKLKNLYNSSIIKTYKTAGKYGL